jgi:FkbM family methyltransferase
MKLHKTWYLPDNDRIGHKNIDNGFPCHKVLPTALRYVKNFNRAIDAGAWIGDSTLFLAERFKEVIAFEAHPDTYECCLKNMLEKNMNNVTVNQVGLSDKTGELQFHRRLKSSNSGWLSNKTPPKDITTIPPITVHTTSLDILDIPNIDFIKIDVDTHEGYLIAGALKWLQKNQPVIMMEVKTRAHNRQFDNMPNPDLLLQRIGYTRIEKIDKHDYIYVPQNYNKP